MHQIDICSYQAVTASAQAPPPCGGAVAACPGATIGEGLAVRGEEVADAEPDVAGWLRRIGLLTR